MRSSNRGACLTQADELAALLDSRVTLLDTQGHPERQSFKIIEKRSIVMMPLEPSNSLVICISRAGADRQRHLDAPMQAVSHGRGYPVARRRRPHPLPEPQRLSGYDGHIAPRQNKKAVRVGGTDLVIPLPERIG